MKVVNYKLTVTQPDGTDHDTLWGTRDSADMYGVSMAPWPHKVEEQAFDVEVGTVVTVRTSDAGREFTGPVEAVEEATGRVYVPTGYSDMSWFYPWQLVEVVPDAEAREHLWLPPVEGIRPCRRLGCYAQWMPGKAEPLGCKGTSSE